VAYYRGDYYRGDYYRGDLGGFFKKAGGALIGAAKGFATGGLVGSFQGALGALTKKQATQVMTLPSVSTAGVGGAIGKVVGTAIKLIPSVAGGVAIEKAIDFFGQRGGNGQKRRTMNHLNPRALARATRRVEGFVKKARKAVSPLGYTVVRRGSSRCAPRRKKC